MDPFEPRQTRRRTTTGESPSGRGRKGWIMLGVFALLLVAYAFVVVSIGGEQAGTAEKGARKSEERAAGREPRERKEERPADDGARADNGDVDRPVTAPGDNDRGESDPDGAPTDGHDHDEVFVHEPEGSDEGSEAGPERHGAKKEPGGYDPLGKDTDGPLLSETQLERAELAVSSYVTAVYGYTGDDFDEYQKKVGEAVVFPGFFSTPGAEHVREVQRQIEGSTGGVTNGAVLNGFTAEQQTEDRIEGVAYFEVGDEVSFSKSAASGVELRGETTSYAQPVNLQLYGPQWRVTAAGQRQEVSD